MKYNEYYQKKNIFIKPGNILFYLDLIIGFNLGLSVPDYDRKESIKSFQSNLIFLTAYSKDELLMDFYEILELNSNYSIKVNPELNPYSSLKVLQSGTMANDIYKKNMYYMIIYKNN
jgi:hypothetical protein